MRLRSYIRNEQGPMEREVKVRADPGICGFRTEIGVKRVSKDRVEISINGSGCRHIQSMAEALNGLTLRELFSPITKNPVYLAAQKARCHPSCIVPVAIIKASEIALEVALPKDVLLEVLAHE